MITKRLWVKRQYSANGFRKVSIRKHFKHTKWEGWFLLGIIPLYIRQLEVSYS
jgi:hypothetical protein